MNSVLQIVKENAIPISKPNYTEHYQRLVSVLKLPNLGLKWGASTSKLNQLKDIGFCLSVTPSFALKFKYHAQVGFAMPRSGVGKFSEDGTRHTTYKYCGDLPDTILDKIALCRNLLPGIGDSRIVPITIHSMKSLPIIVEAVPRLCDPVVIGWLDWMRFDHTWLGWKAFPFNVWGVIIGIFDGEKEIEVL